WHVRLWGMSSPGQQQFLFFAEQTSHEDGSFTVRPRRLVDDVEISVERAKKMLGFKDRETVYRMLKAGRLRGWQPETDRGNGKWRVYLASVLDYKARREKAATAA